jgi:hypothetical protein
MARNQVSRGPLLILVQKGILDVLAEPHLL